jgi:hypothetical protein
MTQEASQVIVSLLKLTSGEEIISQVVVEPLENGQEIIHLVNPCEVQRHVQEDGQASAEFTPMAVFYANGVFQVSGSQIVWSGAPVEEFKQAYLKRFEVAPVEEKLIAAPAEKKLIVPASAKSKKSK